MSDARDPLAALLAERRVLICCGAGGVGKTTVSASLALAAARAGRRVVAITVDPSRRLAEALGVDRNQAAPTPLAEARLAAVGVRPPGELSAWMLDPQLVCDRVVKALATDEGTRARLLGNRVYQSVSTLIAGMQEYTAVEALHGFVRDNRYDLVVLDTPPSRNALRFLETPDRAHAFLDPRIFRLFLPPEGNLMQRAASVLVTAVLDLGLGRAAREELQEFLSLFNGVLKHLHENQHEMRRFFSSSAVSFLLVTSPAQSAVDEAFHFDAKTQALGLPLGGYLLNQSLAWTRALPMPGPELLPPDAPPAAHRAVVKLRMLAEQDAVLVERDERLARSLVKRVGTRGFVRVLPRLAHSGEDLAALGQLADVLASTPDAP